MGQVGGRKEEWKEMMYLYFNLKNWEIKPKGM